MFYWQNRAKVKSYTIRVIVSTWIISSLLAVVPILRIIPGDRYVDMFSCIKYCNEKSERSFVT